MDSSWEFPYLYQEDILDTEDCVRKNQLAVHVAKDNLLPESYSPPDYIVKHKAPTGVCAGPLHKTNTNSSHRTTASSPDEPIKSRSGFSLLLTRRKCLKRQIAPFWSVGRKRHHNPGICPDAPENGCMARKTLPAGHKKQKAPSSRKLLRWEFSLKEE